MQRKPGQLFFLATQGCKVNQYESQAIREGWMQEGLMETHDPALADIILINSCAVTERAIADLGKLVRKYGSLQPKPWIAVAGCAVEADRDRIRTLDGVDETLGQRAKAGLVHREADDSPFPPLNISGYNRARAVLKVQDGCSHGCTYCIIPATRGRSVSRPFAEVIAEARRLLDAGIREISLCGINLRHYGRDLPGTPDFWDLLAAVDRALASDWAGRARLRLGSLEPADMHAKALSTLAASRLMSPHLHLSLQSGSPWVLRRMGRGHYGPDQIFSFLQELRGMWPVFGLGADIIAGFPGETDAHHRETAAVLRSLPLSYAHIFPYSERPGTPAVDFPDSVPGHLRRQRARELRDIVEISRTAFLQDQLLLPCMYVVPEPGAKGMNEYYVECEVQSVVQTSRDMIRVAPVDVHAGHLRTRYMEETS